MNQSARTLFFIGVLCPLLSLQAQVDPAPSPLDTLTENTDLNLYIEDFITGAEVDDQVDYTDLTDLLEDLQKNPLDLNTATQEELIQIPGFNTLLYTQLRDYISSFGALTSLYELQAVEGFSADIIRQVQPYVTVKAVGSKDISPNATKSAGPPAKEVLEGMEVELIQRFVRILEEQRGYTAPDTTFREIENSGELDTVLSSRYAGSPWRSYTRLRGRYGQNFSFAITGEKDPGEIFAWQPENNLYGYDFLSGHVSIGGYGIIERLVIGDFAIQSGQGLTLSRGLGFGKGAFVINSIKQANRGILPYASVNENQYQRGVAATLRFGKLKITPFASRLNVDASVQETDTLTNEVLQASGLQTSGLHRTASERANRNSILENMVGTRIEYRSGNLMLGTTHYYQAFGSELNRALNEYNQFDFRGDENYVNSFDWDWIIQNFNFFGEVGRSRSGGIGATAGIMGSIAPTVDIALSARHFDVDFHSSKGYVFAERPIALANETGLYIGVRVTPTPKWTFATYFDQFYFPFNKFRTGYPSNGWEHLSQLSYKPRRGTEVYVRFRSDNRQQNATLYPNGQKIRYLVPTQRNTLRLHFQTKLDRNIIYRTRAEMNWFTQGEEEQHRGFLLYQDLVWKFGYNFKITGRYALFDVSDFDARIYAYENDVLGFFSIPAYANKGSRYYLIFNAKASRKVDFWFRIAQTRLRDVCQLNRDPFGGPYFGAQEVCQIGSGLDRIDDNRRTEVKVQMRVRF
ncbi:MAG: helix-hairpin-helix domain-containing protein [Bacteroidota bacterium]